MNRSNVGNIVTNAMQTLGISGTQVGKLLRDKADASTALNASDNEASKQIASRAEPNNSDGKPSGASYENMGDDFNERVYQMTQHFLPSDSPQAQAIGQYIRNNLDWFERRRSREGGM